MNDKIDNKGFDFLFSMRGQLIVGSALEDALVLMSNRQPSMLREHSNMKDIEYLLEKFPIMKMLGNSGKMLMPDEKKVYQVIMDSGAVIHTYEYNTLNGIIAYHVAKAHTDHGMKCKAVLLHKLPNEDKTYELVFYPQDEEE